MLPIDPEPLPEPLSAGGDQAGAGAGQPGGRGLAGRGHALFSDSAGDSKPGKAPEQFPGMSEPVEDVCYSPRPLRSLFGYRYIPEATDPVLAYAAARARWQLELARRLMVLFDKPKPGELAWDQELGRYRKW